MRLHHYPGLFGDPRSRGLRLALGISLGVHLVLFFTVGRIHTRPAQRTFFAPVHFVDLVERSPKPAASPSAPPAPPVAKPAKTPPAPAVASPAKTAVAKTSTPKPKPAIDKKAVERLISKTQAPPEPTKPAETRTEENVSERIARMREKYAAVQQPAEPPAQAGDASSVDEAIASIRQRVGPTTSSGKSGDGSKVVGVRSAGANTLQQVRLRAYYNQLWDHVSAYWSIPPSLQSRGYTVIVSVVIDRQGRLVRSWIEEPSASSAFDQSALRALKRAEPLPELPDLVDGDSLEVGFRFNRD